MRVRKSAEFALIQRGGARWSGRYVVFAYRPVSSSLRFGLSVSRKVGGAVVRNRVKRHLREWMRTSQDSFDGLEIVLIARSSASQSDFQTIGDDVAAFLRRVRQP